MAVGRHPWQSNCMRWLVMACTSQRAVPQLRGHSERWVPQSESLRSCPVLVQGQPRAARPSQAHRGVCACGAARAHAFLGGVPGRPWDGGGSAPAGVPSGPAQRCGGAIWPRRGQRRGAAARAFPLGRRAQGQPALLGVALAPDMNLTSMLSSLGASAVVGGTAPLLHSILSMTVSLQEIPHIVCPVTLPCHTEVQEDDAMLLSIHPCGVSTADSGLWSGSRGHMTRGPTTTTRGNAAVHPRATSAPCSTACTGCVIIA